ncbi:MAG: DUF4124 domain-containing protein [Oleispira sp.]
MSFKFSKFLLLITSFILIHSTQSLADIYQWVDSNGRPQFSDSPTKEYKSSGYAQTAKNTLPPTTDKTQNIKDLENIAKEFKQDRLKREKTRVREDKARAKKNKKREKQLALAKKRKQACKAARKKEDLAFRKRTQRQGLVKMRKALANYEKKREARLEKCK